MTDLITVTTELDDVKALALAQFVKRCNWADIRGSAVDDEAYQMRDAIDAVRESLAQAGYAPR